VEAQPNDTAKTPPARQFPAMTYSDHPYPERRGVVLFGGWDGGQDLGDTWVWDGREWTARSSAPRPRSEAAMAFDPETSSIVLFGGRHLPPAEPGQPAPPPEILGDTWLWNGVTWAEAHPTLPPAPRYGSAMAPFPTGPEPFPRDPVVVLFGGRDTGALNETWVWDGTEPAPPPTTVPSTPTSSTTSTTPPAQSQGGGDTGGAAVATVEGGGGGGDPTGGATTGGDFTGGFSQGTNLDTSGVFETSPGAEGSFGFSPSASGNSGFGGAAAVTGLAAAPPAPAGGAAAPTPEAMLPQAGSPAAPVGAAAPGSAAAVRPAPRFLMVGATDPAALATLSGAGLMFAVFCFQLVRRPGAAAPAFAAAEHCGRPAPQRA
jgi:hypothetical protein